MENTDKKENPLYIRNDEGMQLIMGHIPSRITRYGILWIVFVLAAIVAASRLIPVYQYSRAEFLPVPSQNPYTVRLPQGRFTQHAFVLPGDTVTKGQSLLVLNNTADYAEYQHLRAIADSLAFDLPLAGVKDLLNTTAFKKSGAFYRDHQQLLLLAGQPDSDSVVKSIKRYRDTIYRHLKRWRYDNVIVAPYNGVIHMEQADEPGQFVVGVYKVTLYPLTEKVRYSIIPADAGRHLKIKDTLNLEKDASVAGKATSSCTIVYINHNAAYDSVVVQYPETLSAGVRVYHNFRYNKRSMWDNFFTFRQGRALK